MRFPRATTVLSIVALFSVGLNVFFASSFIGREFRRPPPPDFSPHFDFMWRNMPAADQSIARDVFNRRREEIVVKWRALRPSGQSANEVLRATPFDEAMAREALNRFNQQVRDYRVSLQDALLEVAGRVSPEGRAELRPPRGP